MLNQDARVGTGAVVLIAALFFATLMLCGYTAIMLWPPDCVNGQCADNPARYFGWTVTLHRAENLLVIVAVSGAIGALIHAGSSFADYVGNRQLVWSWVWWLVIRVPIGIALALVFYLLIRGGLIVPNGSTEQQINPYGIAGLAALVGMFAKQATDKLAEIFDTLFRSDKEKTRTEPLTRNRDSDPRPEQATTPPELVGIPGGAMEKTGT